MVVIQLPDDLHEYLQLVIKRYSAGGIDPEEGQALYYLNDFAVKKAQHYTDEQLQAMARTVRQPDPRTGATNADELAAIEDREETNRVRAEAGGPLP